MHMRIPYRWRSTPASSRVERPLVCIVDSHAADYECWREVADAAGVQLEFLGRAGDALRLSRSRAVQLWVINTELPDLSGADLCAMLKSRKPQTPVYMVADGYSADQERAAGAARATLFGCKPAHREWLAQWLAHRACTTPTDPARAISTASCV